MSTLFSEEKLIEWKLIWTNSYPCVCCPSAALFSEEKLIEWKLIHLILLMRVKFALFSEEKLIEWKHNYI